MSIEAAMDYSLTGVNSRRAVEMGLAEADWYASPISREQLRKLLQRRNGPAIRDTIIWFTILLVSAVAAYMLWGSWWVVIPLAIYGVVYASSSDSRWHEAGHGTAFRCDWMNIALYEIASFMVMRESTPWRWSHTRHHSDTIIVGRDPEIAVPRPPSLTNLILSFFNLRVYKQYFQMLVIHSAGRITADEKTYIPEADYRKVIVKARVVLLIYLTVIGFSMYSHNILPLMFVGLTNLYGSWLMPIYGYTQHAGLAENVLDHRLNCRTVYMNPINRYLYWNMNYHLEHHMFPLVPYHALPKLHALVKSDMPKPYKGIIEAYREIIPAVLRQRKDPTYCVKRELPARVESVSAATGMKCVIADQKPDSAGWIGVCSSDMLHMEDVLRFDCGRQSLAIYRTDEDRFYATDGVCTHGNTHLATGLVKGNIIECPKHNGRFDITDGSPKRMPVCVALRTYPVRVDNGQIYVNVATAGGLGAVAQKAFGFRVVSNHNVATFIKELILEPMDTEPKFKFTPGDYLQLNIPAYGELLFHSMQIDEPFAKIWREQNLFDCKACNYAPTRRNYSLASNSVSESQLRFNVRIATPPRGQKCDAGAGSSYVFQLKPGDEVTAVGPFGDFHLKPTEREMVYLGGGAGMAPLRAHLSHLFETEQTARKVSFWYGARSRAELFYQDYFENLARRFPNFSFHVALSEPQPTDQWTSHTGFIHEILLRRYLTTHPDLGSIEFYMCGPPAMIKAANRMFDSLRVKSDQIAFDEF